MRSRPALLACALLLAPLLAPTAARAEESAPCRLTGGGCLDVDQSKGHRQATFGGNVGSLHGPWQYPQGDRANTWEHIFRDGKTILFNFHSTDAHVVRCRPERPGPCPPPGGATRVEFEGTGTFNAGPGTPDESGSFEASVVDFGTCSPGIGDSYSIRVRRGSAMGFGEVVYEVSGTIDCGNIQAHAPWQDSRR